MIQNQLAIRVTWCGHASDTRRWLVLPIVLCRKHRLNAGRVRDWLTDSSESGCIESDLRLTWRVKLFYTGPVINTEMLVVMLEKHDIPATQEYVEPEQPDNGDLNRLARVSVPEADYDRAYQLFYAERQDEL